MPGLIALGLLVVGLDLDIGIADGDAGIEEIGGQGQGCGQGNGENSDQPTHPVLPLPLAQFVIGAAHQGRCQTGQLLLHPLASGGLPPIAGQGLHLDLPGFSGFRVGDGVVEQNVRNHIIGLTAGKDCKHPVPGMGL